MAGLDLSNREEVKVILSAHVGVVVKHLQSCHLPIQAWTLTETRITIDSMRWVGNDANAVAGFSGKLRIVLVQLTVPVELNRIDGQLLHATQSCQFLSITFSSTYSVSCRYHLQFHLQCLVSLSPSFPPTVSRVVITFSSTYSVSCRFPREKRPYASSSETGLKKDGNKFQKKRSEKALTKWGS